MKETKAPLFQISLCYIITIYYFVRSLVIHAQFLLIVQSYLIDSNTDDRSPCTFSGEDVFNPVKHNPNKTEGTSFCLLYLYKSGSSSRVPISM